MLALLAVVLAAASLGAALSLAARVRRLSERLERAERRLASPEKTRRLPEPSPLDGLRIALQVEQDHLHPVFSNLLRESLVAEGALVVEDDADVLVRGRLVGNGYADVYYTAELSVIGDGETLFASTEKPPHGDRPENLAKETVARLREEIRKRERRDALRELSG